MPGLVPGIHGSWQGACRGPWMAGTSPAKTKVCSLCLGLNTSWLAVAKADLMAIAEYIAQDNPAAAYAVHDAILRQVGRPADHPQIGRPGGAEGTRELAASATPYMGAYRVAARMLTILRVW